MDRKVGDSSNGRNSTTVYTFTVDVKVREFKRENDLSREK